MNDAYLLDSSIASIAFDAGNRSYAFVRARLAALGDDSVSICVVSVGEVLYGLYLYKSIDLERGEAVKRALHQYKIWDIDRHTASVYARIRADLFNLYAPRNARGRVTKKRPEDLLDKTTARELGIQENDLWIVSVAVNYDLCFIHRDERMKPVLDVAHTLFQYDRAQVWALPQSPDFPLTSTDLSPSR